MTFSATLLLDLEFAIILGVMLSLVVFCAAPRGRASSRASPIRTSRGIVS